MQLLNLGCGNHYHKDWINLDFVSNSNQVIAHDLLMGIPFKDGTIDMVYNSHILEHFSKNQGQEFVKECFRILKNEGIIRIVVPDLEQIIKNYLLYLEMCDKGDITLDFKYEWSKIELFDQVSRNKSGGEMSEVINSCTEEEFKYIKERLGMEINHESKSKSKNFFQKASLISFSKIKYHITIILLKFFAGKKYELAFKTGYFREINGETHKWMYDKYSLYKILENTGFKNIKVMKADESNIKDFNKYELDIVSNKIRKPDSIFIEAIKK